MFITATEVTIFSNISASAATITTNGIIPLAEDRLFRIINNNFEADLYLQTAVTFTASSGTTLANITSDGGDYADEGFIAGDKVYVFNSYRNDGFYEVDSVSTSVLSLVSGSVVTTEKSGASVLVNVVKFPESLKVTLAQMIKYDYDDRKSKSADLTAQSLGPWSESYDKGLGTYGYPPEIMAALGSYTIVEMV